MEAGMRVLRGYSESGKGLAVSCGRERVHAQYSAGRHDHACRCGTERSVSPWFDDHNHVCQRKNGVTLPAGHSACWQRLTPLSAGVGRVCPCSLLLLREHPLWRCPHAAARCWQPCDLSAIAAARCVFRGTLVLASLRRRHLLPLSSFSEWSRRGAAAVGSGEAARRCQWRDVSETADTRHVTADRHRVESFS